jgi:hypothetical protein
MIELSFLTWASREANQLRLSPRSPRDVPNNVVGEDGPGHGHEMERSLMEREDGLNCGVGIYRGYIEMRRQDAEINGSR